MDAAEAPEGSATHGMLSVAATVAAALAAVCSGASVFAPIPSHWPMLATAILPLGLMGAAWVLAFLSRGTPGWRLGLAGALGTIVPLTLTVAAAMIIALTSLGEDLSTKFSTISNQVNAGS